MQFSHVPTWLHVYDVAPPHPTFSSDIIGIVFNRSFQTISYTRNGQHLGIACRNVSTLNQSLMIGFGQQVWHVWKAWIPSLDSISH